MKYTEIYFWNVCTASPFPGEDADGETPALTRKARMVRIANDRIASRDLFAGTLEVIAGRWPPPTARNKLILTK